MNQLVNEENPVEKIEITMAESSIMDIASITPYWRNPRKNELAIQKCKDSIRQYGFNTAIMVDENNVIITGHTRYKSMLELGQDKILTVTNSKLSPELSAEYRIADNAVGQIADWDMNLLPIEMRDMRIEVMQEFFPTINIDSMMDDIKGSISTKVVTEDFMIKTQVNLEDTFKNRSEQQTEDLVEITCPHCGDDFLISQAAIKSQLKVQADDKAADEQKAE